MKRKKSLHACWYGFTLIELLVVISIIGVLSSIVLASLKQSTVKAADAASLVTSRSLLTVVLECLNNGYAIFAPPEPTQGGG